MFASVSTLFQAKFEWIKKAKQVKYGGIQPLHLPIDLTIHFSYILTSVSIRYSHCRKYSEPIIIQQNVN